MLNDQQIMHYDAMEKNRFCCTAYSLSAISANIPDNPELIIHRLWRGYFIINLVISRVGSKNQKFITELRYVTFPIIAFCHELI